MSATRATFIGLLSISALLFAACGSAGDENGDAATEATASATETATATPTETDPPPSPTPSPSPEPTAEPTPEPTPEAVGWTEINPDAPWGTRAGLKVVNIDSTLYLMGGRTPKPSGIPADSDFYGDVWTSSDGGATWDQILETDDASHWKARAYFQAVAKDGEIFLMGGQDFQLPQSDFFNDVWRSSNGVEWTLVTAAAPWEGRAGLSAAVFGDYIYVLGGSQNDDDALIGPTGPPRIYYNDVWRSLDGAEWELMTPAAPWEPRAGAVLLTTGDRLLLLGGEDGFTCSPLPDCDPPYFNDVWTSTDGANWELVTEAAGWSKRPGHACDVIAETIYCFGGFGLIENPMDMWASPDGAEWTQVDQIPWNATDESQIKYDFAWTTVGAGPSGLASILTFGGDRETFDFSDPENYLRVDKDVWRFDGS